MDVTIRRIKASEGALLRDVRLRALRDSPSAFAMTYEDEAAHGNEHWMARAASVSAGGDSTTIVALRADDTIGMVAGYHPDPAHHVVELVSMWTAPTIRRRGVGRRLIDALVLWAAEEASAHTVELWVTASNEEALALYAATGFALTGARAPLPSNPSLEELRMRRRLQ